MAFSRYQREEPFTTLNVDIRNHQNLTESLEQYVKGDLLEGANAYHCEKCNKKVMNTGRIILPACTCISQNLGSTVTDINSIHLTLKHFIWIFRQVYSLLTLVLKV